MRLTHVGAHDRIFFHYMYTYIYTCTHTYIQTYIHIDVFHYMYKAQFAHSPVHDFWIVFIFLAVVNNAAIHKGVQMSVWDLAFNCFSYIPRSRIAGSYSTSIYFLNRHTLFYRNHDTLSYQLHKSFNISMSLLRFLDFFNSSNLNGVEVIHYFGLICNALIVNDVEHLSIHIGYAYVNFREMSIKILPIFKLGYFLLL